MLPLVRDLASLCMNGYATRIDAASIIDIERPGKGQGANYRLAC